MRESKRKDDKGEVGNLKAIWKSLLNGFYQYERKFVSITSGLRAAFLVDPTYPSLHNKRPLLAFLSRPYISGGGRFRRQVL